VLFLSREEVVNLLKDVMSCGIPLPDQVAIMPPNGGNTLSDSEQLHIKATLDEETQKCIRAIIEPKGYRLSLHPEKQLTIIYKPINSTKYAGQK
jgi:hypothetical protein